MQAQYGTVSTTSSLCLSPTPAAFKKNQAEISPATSLYIIIRRPSRKNMRASSENSRTTMLYGAYHLMTYSGRNVGSSAHRLMSKSYVALETGRRTPSIHSKK